MQAGIKAFNVSFAQEESDIKKNFVLLNFPEDLKITKACEENKKKKLYDIVVVLDCSVSMSGSRIRIANGILEKILLDDSVEKMSIIRFGSNVVAPRVYHKHNAQDINLIQADQGGTEFTKPMQSLIDFIKKGFTPNSGIINTITNTFSRSKTSTEENQLMAIFISDGEGSEPTNYYAPLKAVLEQKDCPLLSVAITSDVNPQFMIKLSKLYGETDLVLLELSDNIENGFNLFKNKMQFGKKLLNGSVTVTDPNDKQHTSVNLKFREGQSHLFLKLESKIDLKKCSLKFNLHKSEQSFDIKHDSLDDYKEFNQKLIVLEQLIDAMAKFSIGEMVNEQSDKKEGLFFINNVKQLIQSSTVDENIFEEIEKLTKTNPELIREKIRLQKQKKTLTINLQTKLNQLQGILEGGNLRMALEAYSSKTVSNKFNRRAMAIAQKNAEKNFRNEMKASEINSILESAPDQHNVKYPECILWCINEIACQLQDFSDGKITSIDFSDLDWVGRGCLVTPGKAAALSPWGIESVIVRPIFINNASTKFVKLESANDGRRIARLKGVGIGEFNCSVPFVHPNENINVSRLSLSMIKKTSIGTNAFSDLFCGSPDLFALEQIFSLYSVSALCSYTSAKNYVHYEDCVRSLMTLWDLNFFNQQFKDPTNYSVMKGGNKADLFVKENIERLVSDPTEFFAKKDDMNLPNVLRFFYLMLVGEDHYNALTKDKREEHFTSCKRLILMRTILDNTNRDDLLQDASGFDSQAYFKIALEKLQDFENDDGSNEETADFTFSYDIKNKLFLSRFINCITLLDVLNKFKKEKQIGTFRELHCKLLQKEIKIDELVEFLLKNKLSDDVDDVKRVLEIVEVDDQALANVHVVSNPRVNFDNSVSPMSYLERLVLVSMCKHTISPPPKHDGAYNKTVMSKFFLFDNLYSEDFNQILFKLMSLEEGRAKSGFGELMNKLIKCKKLLKQIKDFKKLCPIEKLYFPFEELNLSFSSENLPKFTSSHKKFAYLNLESFSVPIISRLENLTLDNVADFDLEKMIFDHSQYIHGFSLYCIDAFNESNEYQKFLINMQNKLNHHYKTKNEIEIIHTMNQERLKNIERRCYHFYHDSLIYKFINSLSIELSQEDQFNQVIAKFPECLTANEYNEQNRIEHIQWLINKKQIGEFESFISYQK